MSEEFNLPSITGGGTLGRFPFCSISPCLLGIPSQCPELERGYLKGRTIGEGAELLFDPCILDLGVEKPQLQLGEVGINTELFILKKFNHKE